jgi:phage terminase large subunit
MLCGVPIVRAENNRVQGHMMIKEALANMPDGKPGLLFFSSIKETTADLEDIQADEKNPSDCAKEPHEITHTVDSLRYMCVSRTMRAEAQAAEEAVEDEDENEEDYDSYMTGGEMSADYMAY